MNELNAIHMTTVNPIQFYLEEIAGLKRRNEALREELKLCLENLKDWGSYASDYFQKKHGLAEDIARVEKALAGHHG